MKRTRKGKPHPKSWIAVSLFLTFLFGITSQVFASSGAEILERRTLNSKTLDNGDGTFTFEAHGGHINYVDRRTGKIEECDTTLRDMGDKWVQSKASYACEIPKYADCDFVFIDVFEDKNQTLVMRPLAQRVLGEIDNSDGWVNKRVLYRNAYGRGLHLRVTAGNVGLFKEIIIDEIPEPLRDLAFDFEVTLPSEEHAYVLGSGEQGIIKKVLLANLTLAGDQQLLMGSGTVAENAFSRIRKIRIWDSEGNAIAGQLQFYRKESTLYCRKIVPKEFLATASYPVYTDDTVTYYAGTGDGYTNKGDDFDWDTTHDAAASPTASHTDTNSFFCRTGKDASEHYIITRVFFPFDTSGLPDNAVFSNATLSLYVDSKQNKDDDAEDFFVVVQTIQPSPTSLSTGDYDLCGSVDSPIEGSDRVDLGGISTNQYNTWTLNSTGLGWISRTGWTKLGMREGHDVLDHPIDLLSSEKNRINGYYADYTGTSYDPKLAITYTEGLTVSGTVYQDEGGATVGYNRKISLRVDGGGSYCDQTDFYGTYSITGIDVSPGSTITVWIDDDANFTGTTVTIADPTSNISGLHIYGNSIIVRSDNAGTAITNTDLADYDKDDDPDIHFTSNGGDLVVDSGHTLHMWTGTTFSPGGTVTTSPGGSGGGINIHDGATFNVGGAVSCGGSWTAGTGSTFAHNDNPVTFTATTGSNRIMTGEQPFSELIFNGTGGAWVFADDPTVIHDLTISAGMVVGPSPKFGSYGAATYSSGDNQQAQGQGVAVDASGNSYVVGSQPTNGKDILVLKYDPNGELDTTWGGGDGIVTYESGGSQWDLGYDIVLDGAGSAYVVGTSSNDVIVLKYDSTGALDTAWGGGDGVVTYDGGLTDNGRDIAVDLSGNAYVVGDTQIDSYNTDLLVVKFDASGVLDTAWGGGDGVVTHSSGTGLGGMDYGYGIAVDASGNAYVAGQQATNSIDIVVLKLDPSGELDATWGGGDGIVTYNSSLNYDYGRCIAIDSTGSCYVGGFQGIAGQEIVALKYDANGALDTTWGGGDGIATYGSGTGQYGYGIAVDASGNAFVVGYGGGDILAVKFDANGALDTTWGDGGTVTYNSGGAQSDYGYGIAVDPSSNTYLVGYQLNNTLDSDVLLVKYSATGCGYGNRDGIVTVGGDWSNTAGTFTHSSGDVVFNGGEAQTITSGDSNWHGVVITNASAEGVTFTDGFTCATFTDETAGSKLYFAAGETVTTTAYDGLVLTGAEGDGNLIILRRHGGSDLDQWAIAPQGRGWSVSYVDVENSLNAHVTYINPSNSTDSGNNTNWFTYTPNTISGTVYSDEGTTPMAGTARTVRLIVNGDADIIVDNPEADYVCDWPSVPGGYMDDYQYHEAGDGSCTATWTPYIPEANSYRVYARWVAGANRAMNAPYTINYDGGSAEVSVNQQGHGDQWNYLGTYPFAEGVSGSVELSDGADGFVIADAIKWVRSDITHQSEYAVETNPVDGTYSISIVPMPAGDVFTIFLDDETEKGVTVTRSAGTSISGIDLYQNRVIVRHEDAGPITNVDLGRFDKDNDADIHFTSNSGSLTVDNDHKLHVWTGDTFSPGGPVAGGDIHMDDNATFLAGGPITCGGDWTADTGSAFVHNNGTVTFNGTEAQTITSGGSPWHDVVITNASAGGVSFTDGFTCATFTDVTPGSKLFFAAGETVTITAYEGLALAGAEGEGNLIILRRYGGSGLDQWNINATGTGWSVSYVDVQDANDVHDFYINPSNSTDSSNNTNWFTPTVFYTLTMADDGFGSTTPAGGSYEHPAGTIVEIDAMPVEHYQFDHWTGSGVANPNSASTTVIVDAHKTVTANFSQIMYTLTMAVIGNGSTTPEVGDHLCGSGTVVDISAIPQAPNYFLGWSGSGVADPAAESTTVDVDGDKTVTAHFGIPGANLEVPIEMIDRGISSQTSQVEHTRSAVKLNEADYDGVTEDYYFEIVAENLDTSDRYVHLQDVTYVATQASILVPAGTTETTRFRTSFTPYTGDHVYRIILDGTSSNDQLKVFAARIIIVQTNASKTRIQIPLLNHSHSGHANSPDVGSDDTSSISYSQQDEFRFNIWKKDVSAWGDIAGGAPWTFEAVLRSSVAGTTAYVALFNKTNDTKVAATQLTTSSTTHTLMTVNFATDSTDFDDLDEFEVRHKVGSGATSRLARACLYVKLTNLNKGEVYWRFTRKASASGSDLTHGFQRVLLNTQNYSGAKAYHEATGNGSLITSITTNVLDAGTGDAGTEGSVVPGSGISGNNFSGNFTRGRARKGPLNVTSGHRYIHSITPWIGFVDVANGMLVVGFEAQKVSGTVYADQGVTPMTGSSKTVRLIVNGTDEYTAETNPDDGTYSIPKVIMGPGSVVTVFLDDETEKAVTVTRAACSDNIPGLDMYQNRVIVRNEDAGPITNTNLGEYDGDDDSDIRFTSNDGALTVDNDHGLYVWTNSTFSPGGPVTALSGGPSPGGDIHVDDFAGLEAGGAISCGGSWTMDAGASFTHNSYDVTLNAMSPGRVVRTNSQAFYDLTFDDAGGGWTLQDDLTVANGFTISSGTVTGPDAGTIMVGGNWTNAGTFNHNNGTVRFDGTGAQEVTTGGSHWHAVEITNVEGSVAFTEGFTCATFTDVAARSRLYFATGETFIITASGGLTLTGAEDSLITLWGDGDSDQWYIDPQGGGWDVSYVNVADSENLQTLSIAPFDSINSGNNTNWFEARPVYLTVTGGGTQTAGNGQEITITAYNQYYEVATDYTGDKSLTFSGASASSVPPTNPTCSDKSGMDIAFGSPTTVTFTDGVGTSTIKLYNDQQAQIDVSDGFLDSTSDGSYDLDVTVSPAPKNKLLWVGQPRSPVAVHTTWPVFTVEITDQYGNRTSDTDTITVSPSAGSLGGTTAEEAVSGLVAFDDIMCDLNITITLTGTADGLVSTPPSNDVVVLGHSISGYVGTLEGVTMSGLPGDPVTGANGFYLARVDHGWSGTVIPTKVGYTFIPVSKAYTDVTSDQTKNYTPTINTYKISGQVGTLDGVTMSGFLGDPVITSDGGAYTAWVEHGWTGTVTPVKVGYTFNPTSITYENVTEKQTNQNYTPIINIYTISGSVGTLDGVVMNGLPGNPVTSAGGSYFAKVEHGWSGTVTPTKDGPTTYTFDPASKTYPSVTSDLTDQNYTPSIDGYTLTMCTAISGIGSTTPAVGEHVYGVGEEVPITAEVFEGWAFESWTGDVATPSAASTTVFMDENKTVIANYTNTDPTLDVPHYAHRTSPRGPKLGDDCAQCHAAGSDPAHDNVVWNVCNTCHSPSGVFNGVTDPLFGAISNWQNSDPVAGNPASADESLIYESNGTLKADKDKWCAACHDHETGAEVLDNFSSYANTTELQGVWSRGNDVEDRTLQQYTYAGNMQPWERGKCMIVDIDWSNSLDVNWGRVKRSFDPPLDLSNRTHFNFYLKLADRTQVEGVRIHLQKMDDTASMADMATGSGTGFINNQWHLVSLPKASFDDPDWSAVKLISFTFYEQNPDQSGTTRVWLDEVGCDVTGPDVVRNNSDSGYYKTGHKMLCSRCHDSTSEHIDDNRLPFIDYIKSTNNPTSFRFYDDPDMQMQLPYTGGYATEKFALCFRCHEESWLMEQTPYQQPNPELKTNFREDRSIGIGDDHNLHVYHLSGWSATCLTCHDPHGQWNPAMSRKEVGDLVYTYDYTYDGETIPNRTVDINGNGVPDWYDGEVNFYGKMTGQFDHTLCTSCHPGAYLYYYRTYKRISHGGPCGDCHDAHALDQSHTTHTQANPKGPDALDCSHCHGLGFDPDKCEDCHGEGHQVISTIDDMVTVGACDNCHSPGGQYGFDGVQMGKANWELGVYEEGWLRPGSEKWCASCHDDDPASSNADGTGELAPTISGDNDTFGYYVTGHGRDAEAEYDLMCFQEGSGNGNPGADVICDHCHDSSSDHIVQDGHVTRLKAGFENNQGNATCVQCHPPGTDATAPPDLYTNSDDYEAAGHGGRLCTECHDVHGMVPGAYPAMTGGDCRGLCLSCHNVQDLPETVSAHDENSDESCSSGCHNPHMPAHGGGQGAGPVCFSAGCHTVNPMHAAHFDPVEGAGFPINESGCYFCHSDGRQQCGEHASFFKTGTDENADGKYSLSETDVCNLCHIAGGP
jgi:uncharacterized delta-60 repeat protein